MTGSTWRPSTGPETRIEGYASLFWRRDLAGDVVAAHAFSRSLGQRGQGAVKLLYQHDPHAVVGAWDSVTEDSRGLFVRGRIIEATAAGRYAASLARAGVLDGLSIGFQTRSAHPDKTGSLRILTEIELWEVSLVSFPMLPAARFRIIIPSTDHFRSALAA